MNRPNENEQRPKRPRGTGSVYRMKNSAVWWIKYHRNGKPIRESTSFEEVKKAEKLLQKRLGEVATDTFIEPKDRRITVDECYAGLLDDYRNNELATLEDTQRRWQRPAKEGEKPPEPGRLKQHFAGIRALAVTTDMLNKYVGWCREQGLANATINRDLAALRRAFMLGRKAGKLQRVPVFPHLKEAAPRSGFVEEADYIKLARNARQLWLRALLATAYTFGFRKGELVNLRVSQVDLLARTIRLNVGETKSGEGRLVKLTQDVYTLLQACVAGKQANDFVFTRSTTGKPILDFRDRWVALTEAAGCPGLSFTTCDAPVSAT